MTDLVQLLRDRRITGLNSSYDPESYSLEVSETTDPLCISAAEEIERLRKDANRYRHMRSSVTFQDRNGPGLYWYLPRWDRALPIGERLDKAIDDAIKAKP